MAEAIVSDWLAEYNSLEPQEIRSFAALHAENHELSTAIQAILNDKTKHPDVSGCCSLFTRTISPPVNFSFSSFIRFAFNSTTSIDRTRTSSNASRCSSFRTSSSCTWMPSRWVRSRVFGAWKRWFCALIISKCAALKDCWSQCLIECQFLLNLRYITRREIFLRVISNDGKSTAIKRFHGGQWIKCIKSQLKIDCRWWRLCCSSSTSKWAWFRNRLCIIFARSARNWPLKASLNTVILIVHRTEVIL